MNPIISICLLSYNHDHLLAKTISSILRQTFEDYELIISDDCSTDDSWNIIADFSSRNNKIKAVKPNQNLGMAGNANFAFSYAKSKYVALLCHDDIVSKELLIKWLHVIEKDESIGFVFNNYSTGNNIGIHAEEGMYFQEIMNGKEFKKKYLLKQWGCPVRASALIRKSYLEKLKGMDENFGMLADIDLWMRLSSISNVGYVKEKLIKVINIRKADYPKDYTEFSWKRIFLLFDIHSSNINRYNYSNEFIYLFQRIIFRNKVSIEIIKWSLYALYKKQYQILKTFPVKYKLELFYSILFRWFINLLYNQN
jgi:glycosyltransferase involved in cell wall biosynthesis